MTWPRFERTNLKGNFEVLRKEDFLQGLTTAGGLDYKTKRNQLKHRKKMSGKMRQPNRSETLDTFSHSCMDLRCRSKTIIRNLMNFRAGTLRIYVISTDHIGSMYMTIFKADEQRKHVCKMTYSSPEIFRYVPGIHLMQTAELAAPENKSK